MAPFARFTAALIVSQRVRHSDLALWAVHLFVTTGAGMAVGFCGEVGGDVLAEGFSRRHSAGFFVNGK